MKSRSVQSATLPTTSSSTSPNTSSAKSNSFAASQVTPEAESTDSTLAQAEATLGQTPPPSATLRSADDYDSYTELIAGKAPSKPAEVGPTEEGSAPSTEPTAADVTGIATQVAIGRFVTAAKKVETDWGTLSEADRANNLGKAANDELKAVGVPETGIVVKDLGQPNGQLDFTGWNLDLNEKPFQKTTTTTGEMAGMADTVYHESRHAEQWHRMARLEAGKGKTATEIASAMYIPANVAQDAAKKPLTGDSAEAKEAEAWHESVYGANSAARNTTLQDLSTHGAALNAALAKTQASEKAYNDLVAAGTATADQLKAAMDTWVADYAAYQTAQTQFNTTYQAYRDLPEEKDAWAVGGDVRSAYTSA